MIKKIALVFVVVALVFAASIGFSFWKGIQEISKLVVVDVDLTQVADGIYTGEYRGGIAVRVNVEVKDHKITAIDIVEHNNGKGAAAENIVQGIVSGQSLQVDTVSGATMSSKVILKAVEIALRGQAQ